MYYCKIVFITCEGNLLYCIVRQSSAVLIAVHMQNIAPNNLA